MVKDIHDRSTIDALDPVPVEPVSSSETAVSEISERLETIRRKYQYIVARIETLEAAVQTGAMSSASVHVQMAALEQLETTFARELDLAINAFDWSPSSGAGDPIL